jgi:hypothetical protein
MTLVLISGASVSAGAGLENGSCNPNLFVNRLATEVLNCSLNQVDNISINGIDNKRIFLDTALKIITKKYNYVLVCWQTIPKINIEVGLETYRTTVPIISPGKLSDNINLFANQHIEANQINRISEYLLRYYNAHWEILDLIKYINILQHIAQETSTKLYFINYSFFWDANYFQQVEWNVLSDLTQYTQEILQVEFRDDQKVGELYSMIHDQYSLAGGIREELWLNLYQNLRQEQIDTISNTDKHPGLLSQDRFVEILKPILDKKLA